MADAIDMKIAQQQLTAQILEKIGVTDTVKVDTVGTSRPPEKRIDEYAKHFRRLYKVISEPLKEE